MLLTNVMLLHWYVTSYSCYCCGSEGTWLGNCFLFLFLWVVCCQFGSVYVTRRGAVTEWLSDVLKTSKQTKHTKYISTEEEEKLYLARMASCFCCKSRQFRNNWMWLKRNPRTSWISNINLAGYVTAEITNVKPWQHLLIILILLIVTYQHTCLFS